MDLKVCVEFIWFSSGYVLVCLFHNPNSVSFHKKEHPVLVETDRGSKINNDPDLRVLQNLSPYTHLTPDNNVQFLDTLASNFSMYSFSTWYYAKLESKPLSQGWDMNSQPVWTSDPWTAIRSLPVLLFLDICIDDDPVRSLTEIFFASLCPQHRCFISETWSTTWMRATATWRFGFGGQDLICPRRERLQCAQEKPTRFQLKVGDFEEWTDSEYFVFFGSSFVYKKKTKNWTNVLNSRLVGPYHQHKLKRQTHEKRKKWLHGIAFKS